MLYESKPTVRDILLMNKIIKQLFGCCITNFSAAYLHKLNQKSCPFFRYHIRFMWMQSVEVNLNL